MRKFIIVTSLILAALSTATQATTYYIDYVGGADSNNGLSTAAPWKRHPYMPGFTGSYTHIAGDRFIFKGGVTWPNLVISFQAGGSSPTVRDYYGVDPAWFSGGAWSRPVMDYSTHPGANVMYFMVVYPHSYIEIDNFEFKGAHWDNSQLQRAGMIELGTSVYVTVRNCKFHAWFWAAGTTSDPLFCVDGNPNSPYNVGCEILDCEAFGPVVNNSAAVGICYDIPIVKRNRIYNMSNGPLINFNGECEYNDVGPIYSSISPVVHENGIENLNGGNILINGNLVHEIYDGVSILVGWCNSTKITNNVIWNTAHMPIDTGESNTLYICNNTTVSSEMQVIARGTHIRISGPTQTGTAYVRNNHFISNYGFGVSVTQPITTYVNDNNTNQSETDAAAAGYISSNYFAPTDSTDTTVNTGVTFTLATTTDRLGVSRPQGSAWDRGAYEFTSSAPAPGTLSFSASSYSVSESGTSVTITVTRSGGSSGAVGCSYATSNGTATAGSDYTSASGTLSWNDGETTSKTFNISITSDSTDEDDETISVALSSATGGASLGLSSATVTITDDDLPLMNGLSFEAEDGLIESPFSESFGLVSQETQTTDPSQGGRARYKVTIPSTGAYKVIIELLANTDATNSLFIDFDQEPTTPTAIWDIVELTAGVDARTSAWRGNGTFDNPEYDVKTWQLSAGEHTLYIRGREGGCGLDNITIVPISASAIETLNVTNLVLP